MKISQATLLSKEAARAERNRKAWEARANMLPWSKDQHEVKELMAALDA